MPIFISLYFLLVIADKEYVITYVEENKYSKHKIIEVLYDNIKVDESIITQKIRNKYNFYYYFISYETLRWIK